MAFFYDGMPFPYYYGNISVSIGYIIPLGYIHEGRSFNILQALCEAKTKTRKNMFKVSNVPANLFIDTPEIHDASLHKLSNNIESWPEDIIQKLKEKVPKVAGMNTMVKFMKKDEENGTATGSVVINSPEKTAIVPLIIKDFMLYPMDIMVAKQKLLPLTPDYFESIFDDNNIFQKIEEYPTYGGMGRFEDANMWEAIYPPSLGRYAYASAGYPILDAISDTIDGEVLKETIRTEKVATARFFNSEHMEVIRKVANLKPVNMNEFSQATDKLLPKSVVMVLREGPNKYTSITSSDEVFHPAINTTDRAGTCHFISTMCDHVDDVVNEVDQNGEKMLVVPKGDDEIFLARPDDHMPESADEYDHYSVRTKTGVNVEGIVIPKVIDFDQEIRDLKLFIGKTMSTMQKEIYGVRCMHSGFTLEGSFPKVGQTGTFVFNPDASHGLATIPVTVKTVVEDCGKIILKVYTLMGEPLKLILCTNMHLERIARVPSEKHPTYMIPGKMKWVPMDNMCEVSNSPHDYLIKSASQVLTNRPVTVIPTGYGQYSVRGLQKYASSCGWDHTNLSEAQVKFILTSQGVSQEKIASSLKYASRAGSAELHNLRFTPLIQEKVARRAPAREFLSKFASKYRCDLYKEASYIDNSQTIDALLSLNFITPDNISKFINMIPSLKSAISTLASCLMASRLGIKEISENAASTAMHRMIEVVTGLERLRATQEINAG